MSLYDDPPKFKEGKDYNEWFDLNEDLIHELIRNDPHELLYAAWLAGYGVGLDSMAEMLRPKI